MALFEAIKPRTFYETLVKVVRNFRNHYFYKKVMLQLLKDKSLAQNGMRLGKRQRAYYVLNLEPELLLMGEETMELERSRVYESLSKKKPLFEKAGLGELIEAKTKRIKDADHYAYLVQIKYLPIATLGNFAYLLVWLFGFSLVIYLLVQLGLQHQAILDWLGSVMTAK